MDTVNAICFQSLSLSRQDKEEEEKKDFLCHDTKSIIQKDYFC